jgi:predicted Zn-dependent protease
VCSSDLADRVRIKKMVEAGYDPRGSLEALEKLKLAADISEMAAPAYLMTHPGILDRIAFLGAIKSDRPAGAISPNGLDWPWFRVRLAMLSGRRSLLKNLSAPLAEYAQALAELEAGRNQEALASLTKLHQDNPQRLGLAESLAEALLRVGRTEEAARALEATLAQRPDNPGALLLLGQVQLERGKLAEALRSFKELQRLWPYDPQVWRQLSIASGRAGDLVKAHTHLAQAFVLLGDRVKALQNYDLALRQAKSPEERGQIEAERKEALGVLPPPAQPR